MLPSEARRKASSPDGEVAVGTGLAAPADFDPQKTQKTQKTPRFAHRSASARRRGRRRDRPRFARRFFSVLFSASLRSASMRFSRRKPKAMSPMGETSLMSPMSPMGEKHPKQHKTRVARANTPSETRRQRRLPKRRTPGMTGKRGEAPEGRP